MQARQLLTDPAVAREFERLRSVAEAKAQEVRKLQEELQAVNFSQDSKAGRLLMAKCRALQVSFPPHRSSHHTVRLWASILGLGLPSWAAVAPCRFVWSHDSPLLQCWASAISAHFCSSPSQS